LSSIENFACWSAVFLYVLLWLYWFFYYIFLIYSLNTPKYCQNFCIYVDATNNINLTRTEHNLFYSFHVLLLHSFMYKYIFIFVYKWLQGLSKIFLSYFPKWCASSVRIYPTRQISQFWGTWCQCVPTYFNRIAKHITLWVGRTLWFAAVLDKTERNVSSNVILH